MEAQVEQSRGSKWSGGCLPMGNGKTLHASGSPGAYSTEEEERPVATKQIGIGASC